MEKPWMMLCCSPGDRLRMNGIFKNKLLLIPPLLHYCSEENMVIGSSSSFFFLNGFLLHLSMVTCYTSVRALGLGNRQVMRKPYVYIQPLLSSLNFSAQYYDQYSAQYSKSQERAFGTFSLSMARYHHIILYFPHLGGLRLSIRLKQPQNSFGLKSTTLPRKSRIAVKRSS